MQQTEKYKFNLIEPSDPFLPDGLNENTQKIEDALTAHENTVEQRLTVLEGHKVALGSYTGTCRDTTEAEQTKEQFVYLGFRPRVGVFWLPGAYMTLFEFLRDPNEHRYIRVSDDGFYVRASMNSISYVVTYLIFS